MKKIIGKNYLHTHPIMEVKCGIDNEHCIVDKKDLIEVQNFFEDNSGLIKCIDNGLNIDYNNEILLKRPFEIKAKAEVVDTNNHPTLTNVIIEKLNNKDRFVAKVLIKGERLWCIVIGRSDSHNANFSDSEEGEIFVGILDNEPINNENLHFNDLIEFQSCDVFEIQNLS